MTPEQTIKAAMLAEAVANDDIYPADGAITAENVDVLWEELVDADKHCDYQSEMRGGTVETGLRCEWSRHYESKAVARKFGEQWVGWTYWYGGGKHGEPEAVEWMSEAYFLTCVEEQKTVTVQTFTKVEVLA